VELRAKDSLWIYYTSVPNGQTDTINIAAVPFAVVVQDVSERVDAPEHFKDQGRGPAEDRYAIAWCARDIICW